MAVKTINDTILTNIADAIREKGGASGTIYPHNMPQAIRNISSSEDVQLQQKEVTPTNSIQNVVPDSGYDGLSKVVVNKIPSNYGLISYNGSSIRVS